MNYVLPSLVLAFSAACLPGAGDDFVFRTDVSLVRVDAHVLDRDSRTLSGLGPEDFVLIDNGRRREISHFAREAMPVDVVLLLDVSGSMRPHVERIAAASRKALRVLGNDDRVAIMVFDRETRVRMSFRNSRGGVEREFDRLLDQETFDGGTDITRGLLDAAAYVGSRGRSDARRAVVILTDDQTERDRDEERVSRALLRADAVLMALIAPDAMGRMWRSPGGIIFGRRRSVVVGPGTKSAGTAAIARESGGDSMPVDEANALETALSRIRERYALYFHLPEGTRPGQEQIIDVQLTEATRARHPAAQVRFRRVYLAPGAAAASSELTAGGDSPPPRRRLAVSEPDGPQAPRDAQPAPSDAPVQAPENRSGGWRRVKPGDEP
ncbi:MAG: VWA domain-containing protein [Rhodospirillales bacterium]